MTNKKEIIDISFESWISLNEKTREMILNNIESDNSLIKIAPSLRTIRPESVYNYHNVQDKYEISYNFNKGIKEYINLDNILNSLMCISIGMVIGMHMYERAMIKGLTSGLGFKLF